LACAIVYQQLSTKAAATILGRFQEAAVGRLTPESIQQLTVAEMRQAGLSKQKIGYIRDLAEHAISGKLDFATLPDMSDEEVLVALTDIKGIGVWTAHMFLMFALRRPNVLPVGDLGIRMAIKQLYKKRKMPLAKDIEKLAKGWHPYCSVASWYLWRSLELKSVVAAKKASKKKRPAAKGKAAKKSLAAKA
jgi:DNA-3-methyladenine glycosylase II